MTVKAQKIWRLWQKIDDKHGVTRAVHSEIQELVYFVAPTEITSRLLQWRKYGCHLRADPVDVTHQWEDFDGSLSAIVKGEKSGQLFIDPIARFNRDFRDYYLDDDAVVLTDEDLKETHIYEDKETKETEGTEEPEQFEQN